MVASVIAMNKLTEDDPITKDTERKEGTFPFPFPEGFGTCRNENCSSATCVITGEGVPFHGVLSIETGLCGSKKCDREMDKK